MKYVSFRKPPEKKSVRPDIQSAHTFDRQLPIYEKYQQIIDTIRSHQVVIIAGETGCGKTTQLPLICAEARRGRKGKVVCTQPRRIAAISLAHYVASLLRPSSEISVGYKVRFHDKTSCATRIQFVTDGILLAQISRDPLLEQYDTIIIDEAHERNINIDFLLGYMRVILRKRPDLKLIISSATIDTRLFSRSFNHAPIITVTGRHYPVEIQYKPIIEMWDGERMHSYTDCIVTVVQQIITAKQHGDILIFLPTIQDIYETLAGLQRIGESEENTVFLPLHSRLSVMQQKKIFSNTSARKIVVATNIAETSITVPGIRYVIDTGLARISRWDPVSCTSRMPIERISKAAANQRTGRCGRVRDGICIRLFSPHDYNTRPAYSSPEIKRCNLASIILRMHYLHLGKIDKFPFLQRPSHKAIHTGYCQLKELGALSPSGTLTELGKKMARLPLDPPIACMLLYARNHHAVREVTIIAAALSVDDPRLAVNDKSGSRHTAYAPFIRHESDFMTFVTLWDALHDHSKKRLTYTHLVRFCQKHALSFHRIREWIDIHQQIQRLCSDMIGHKRSSGPPASYESIHKSLLCGLNKNIALRQHNGLYQGGSEHDIMISPDSVLFHKKYQWILFHRIVETSRIYGKTAGVINPRWLEELFPDQCSYSYENIQFDLDSDTVWAQEKVWFRGLPLIRHRQVPYSEKNREQAHGHFIQEALIGEKALDHYAFLQHNHAIKHTVITAENKLRSKHLYCGDNTLETFYRQRLGPVVSMRDINHCIKNQRNDRFLFLQYKDICTEPLPDSLKYFPDTLTIGTRRISVRYTYEPGKEDDGAVLCVSESLFRHVPLYYWEWLLPVFCQERITIFTDYVHDILLCHAVDKKHIHSVLRDNLSATPSSFLAALCRLVTAHFSITLRPEDIPLRIFPQHLWVRVDIFDQKGNNIDSFRPPFSYPSLPHPAMTTRSEFWAPFCSPWERNDIRQWDFGHLPQHVQIKAPEQLAALPAYAALCEQQGCLHIRTFMSKQAALKSHDAGVRRLLELALAKDLAWILREFTIPPKLEYQCRNLLPAENLRQTAVHLLQQAVLEFSDTVPVDPESFTRTAAAASARIPSAPARICTLLETVADRYETCRTILNKKKNKYNNSFYNTFFTTLSRQLDDYRTLLYNPENSFTLVSSLVRYLDAFHTRIETAYLNPKKFRNYLHTVAPYKHHLYNLKKFSYAHTFHGRNALEKLIILIETYTIEYFSPQAPKKRDAVTEKTIQDAIDTLYVLFKSP